MNSLNHSVPLEKIIKHFDFEVVFMPENGENIPVSSPYVSRPGLQLCGFLDYYENNRIQVMGKLEMAFLDSLSLQEREDNLRNFIRRGMPAIIVTRCLKVIPLILGLAMEYEVPILRTSSATSGTISVLMQFLNEQLAIRETLHGVFVDVFGMGILILGDSGIGKSETALSLIRKGHRLIADDAVEIRKVASGRLVGTVPPIIKNFMEIRGIGILDIEKIFGVRAIKDSSDVDLIVNLEEWDDKKDYDRLGLDIEYKDLLGVDIPMVLIPVRPGRDLAIIIEMAAMNARLKSDGENAAEELNQRLMDNLKNLDDRS